MCWSIKSMLLFSMMYLYPASPVVENRSEVLISCSLYTHLILAAIIRINKMKLAVLGYTYRIIGDEESISHVQQLLILNAHFKIYVAKRFNKRVIMTQWWFHVIIYYLFIFFILVSFGASHLLAQHTTDYINIVICQAYVMQIIRIHTLELFVQMQSFVYW